jgi:UDP-N-acetylmuramoylalanine--D-glutamate ligase
MKVQGSKFLVVGLARTGLAAARFLASKGGIVTVTDLKTKTELKDEVELLSGSKVKLELGRHVQRSFTESDYIVLSPGIPRSIKPLEAAVKAGVPVISDVELASLLTRTPIIAVTGTNGKTTVTSLIGEIIEADGQTSFVGGNIGNPVSEYLASNKRTNHLVLEVSSFQLESTDKFKPKVAVLLNLAEDHLDRYADYEEYVQAKARILRNLSEKDIVVANYDDRRVRELVSGLEGPTVLYFSAVNKDVMGAYIERNSFFLRLSEDAEVEEYPLDKRKIRGIHNVENMMAAAISCRMSGISKEAVLKSIETFRGVEHRLEFVKRKCNVYFYNDSKGTNVNSMMKSINSFQEPVILIAGGKDKGCDFTPLIPTVQNKVKSLILVGEAKERINRSIGDHAETYLVGTFDEAVFMAYQKSRSGDVILLSPGCSSFDMFRDYEHRGRRFKEIVDMF